MTNTLDTIIPKIVTRGMMSFRERAIMPRLVNADFSAEAAQKGAKVDVMIPGDVAVSDVEPGAVNDTVPDTTAHVAEIELNNWKKVAFYLSDKDMMQVDADNSFVPFHMQEAIAALAEEVNRSFYREVLRARHVIGVPGKTLFSDTTPDRSMDYGSINPMIKGRQLLNEAKAPKSGRYGVFGFEEESRIMGLPQFAEVDKSGDTSIRLEGEIGRKFGIQFFSSDQVYTYTPLFTDRFYPVGNIVKGAKEGEIRDFAREPVLGDVVLHQNKVLATIEGINATLSPQSYDVRFSYPLQRSVSQSSELNVAPTHRNNMIFHRDAFAFATRPLSSVTEGMGFGNRIMSVTDPETGLSLRLEISRQYKRTVWEFDILWGVKLVRPEFAIRLIS